MIRPARPEDGEAIARLFMRAWHISLKDFVPAGFLERFDHDVQKQKYAARAADPGWILLVAEMDGRVAGVIGVVELQEIKTQEIKTMYVDPDFQELGIGSALLEASFTAVKSAGARKIMLWCIRANRKACKFYEKHGGRRIENIDPPEEYSAMVHVVYAWRL